jgi:uncharacterized protein
MNKYKKLKNFLNKLDSAVIAFSGGLDSGLLTKVAFDCLGKRVIAVTATSPTYTLSDVGYAKKAARNIGVRHMVIKTKEFHDKNFIKNSRERCYFCKKELFFRLKTIARAHKLSYILDGSNYDDRHDARPGLQANREFGVVSPLYECGFSKKDISVLALKLGLFFWNKPQAACLSSRIPFGERITVARIKKIQKAEAALKNFFGENTLLRARDHNEIVRIELKKENWTKLNNSDINKIIKKLKAIGYTYVTLDLEGYIPAGLR